jgi:hypothetical protein
MKNQPLLDDTERKSSDSDQTRRKSDTAVVPESAPAVIPHSHIFLNF